MPAGTKGLEVSLMSQLPESAYWLALAYASGLNLARVKAMVSAWCLEAGQPLAKLFALSVEELAARLGPTAQEGKQVIVAARHVPEQADWLGRLESDGTQLITRADARYPQALIHWLPPDMQPLLLFCRGDVGMLSQPSGAVLGARNARIETVGLARELAMLLAEEGLVVISGLGKGAGQAAFEGALSAEGRALAVLPMGINAFHSLPDSREGVAAAVERGQALLLSPFHPDAKFSQAQAIARNRLMIGLAGAVFVMAAGEEGVTREIAGEALRKGKTVYIWDMDPDLDPAAASNQALIQAGGLPIAGISHILDAVETVVATALELAEGAGAPPARPQSPTPQVKEADAEAYAYDPQAVLDLLSDSGRVPEALSRRLRGDSEAGG